MTRQSRPWSKEDVARAVEEHNRQVKKKTAKRWRKECRQQWRRNRWRTIKARFWGRW